MESEARQGYFVWSPFGVKCRAVAALLDVLKVWITAFLYGINGILYLR